MLMLWFIWHEEASGKLLPSSMEIVSLLKVASIIN